LLVLEEVREDDSLDIDSESNTPAVLVNGDDRGLGLLLVLEEDGGGSE